MMSRYITSACGIICTGRSFQKYIILLCIIKNALLHHHKYYHHTRKLHHLLLLHPPSPPAPPSPPFTNAFPSQRSTYNAFPSQRFTYQRLPFATIYLQSRKPLRIVYLLTIFSSSSPLNIKLNGHGRKPHDRPLSSVV